MLLATSLREGKFWIKIKSNPLKNWPHVTPYARWRSWVNTKISEWWTSFRVARFSKTSILMGPFMLQNTVSKTFFTNRSAQNFFFTEKTMCFHLIFRLFDIGFGDKNLLLRTPHTFFCKFHLVCTSWPPKIRRQTSVQAWSTWLDFPLFWISSKGIFFTRLKKKLQ